MMDELRTQAKSSEQNTTEQEPFDKLFKRFCRTKSSCMKCPLTMYHIADCPMTNVEPGAIDTILQWGRDNPPPKYKTYMDVFLEHFPDSGIEDDPSEICRRYVFGSPNTYVCADLNCENCWNEPYPDDDTEEE